MKNCGLFLNMAKGVFWGLFFWGFNVIVVCFLCVCHSSKSVKNACFPQFFGLFWGGFVVLICVWKVWVFLCFLFLVFFLVLVLFLFVCFVLFCGWMLLFLFLFFFLFIFCFTSLGPKPSLFFGFCFYLFFCCFFVSFFCFCFCLEGLRVRWGGPKGHLTWP